MAQESISGFRKEGTWEEVVEHGEEITRIMKDADADADVEGSNFDDWQEWRPKNKDDMGDDIVEKTAKKASIDPDGDSGLKKASKKLFCSLEKAVYENVMGKASPCYFDNDLVSANIKDTSGRIGDSETFALEVDVYDADLKDEIRQNLE
ncbi:MAG: DUF5828 family protein [Halobacteria archaeon]|nr:DUF5828 family protein [Halobacteria archaeon]